MSDRVFAIFRRVPFFLLFCVLLCSCSLHDHEWQDATCTAAKTCSICGNTDGNSLGHQWADATCSTPKTCSVCGETTGKPISHKWKRATCELPKTCSLCGAQEGGPLGHHYYATTWRTSPRPTCQVEGKRTNTCSRCGAVTVESVPVVDCTPGSWKVVEDDVCCKRCISNASNTTDSQLICGTNEMADERKVTNGRVDLYSSRRLLHS